MMTQVWKDAGIHVSLDGYTLATATNGVEYRATASYAGAALVGSGLSRLAAIRACLERVYRVEDMKQELIRSMVTRATV